MTNQALKALIDSVLSSAIQYVKRGDDGELHYLDPLNGNEIRHHYGKSHLAAAFIIYDILYGHAEYRRIGLDLVYSLIHSWHEDSLVEEYHHDFNNFALCLIYNSISEDQIDLKVQLGNLIIKSEDSNHETINWLPMRIYVNMIRYRLSNETIFLHRCEALKRLITIASNQDGGIEDRLPKGTSFNLQYHVSTSATLQFLNLRGADFDLTRSFGFVYHRMLLDKDFNYLGRGTNQLFGWGPWLYCVGSIGDYKGLDDALSFCSEHVLSAISNQNLVLNRSSGHERLFWWDYHYFSVYLAHFGMWLCLTALDLNKSNLKPFVQLSEDSGLIKRVINNWEVVLFNGRSEYVAENGPMLTALSHKKFGVLFKGPLGPGYGKFGKLHKFPFVVPLNFFGLMEYSTNATSWKRIFMWMLKRGANGTTFSPVFSSLELIENTESRISIRFSKNRNFFGFLNIPSYLNFVGKIKPTLSVDGRDISISLNQQVFGPYGWMFVFQSEITSGKVWVLSLEERSEI